MNENRYRIITGNRETVERKVSEALDRGYDLREGVQTFLEVAPTHCPTERVFMQVVVQPKRDRDE